MKWCHIYKIQEDISYLMTIKYRSKTVEQQFCSKYQKKWRYPEPVKEKLKATEKGNGAYI